MSRQATGLDWLFECQLLRWTAVHLGCHSPSGIIPCSSHLQVFSRLCHMCAVKASAPGFHWHHCWQAPTTICWTHQCSC